MSRGRRTAAVVCSALVAFAGVGVLLWKNQHARPRFEDSIHSPNEVDRAFATNGLRLFGTAWTIPREDATNISGLASEYVPTSLSVAVWSSVHDAKRDEALSREPATGLLGSRPWPEIRVGNVTVTYDPSSSAERLARIRAATTSLAAMPSVLPPSSGVFPRNIVAGDTATSVRSNEGVLFQSYAWWCGSNPIYGNGRNPGKSPEIDCQPRDTPSVQLTVNNPLDKQRITVVSQTPGHVVRRLSDSHLLLWAFPFGPTTMRREDEPVDWTLPVGSGATFKNTSFACAAMIVPVDHINCYRTVGSSVETPFVLFYPGVRVMYVESAVAPSGGGDAQSGWTYDFSA
jgi:hypothetical protein